MQLEEMRHNTGMIIPVWFPESMDIELMKQTLMPVLTDAMHICNGDNILIVIDGSVHARDATFRLRDKLGHFEVLILEKNLGKGGAVAAGLKRLFKNPDLEYFITRDHDNDHLANDALNLARLAKHMRSELGHNRVMTIGRRTSIHRHLGFERGEFEVMMNEFSFAAATFSAARSGFVFDTQFFAGYDLVPDMQTGFKCYTRDTACLMITSVEQLAVQDLDIQRHGAEIPPIIETLLAKGTIGEINRVSWENQPITTYDSKNRIEVKGTVLAWVLMRSALPLEVAKQLLANAIARRTLAKEENGMDTLKKIANWALTKAAAIRDDHFEPLQKITFSDYF
ncbi:MAG: glycosyltransferase [Lentisphaerae bacterium]|nr:glycosyltransferase [Lentisphaerota bacterium]